MRQKVHFVGIGGSGISGVAALSEKFGYKVSGCDLEKNTAYGQKILKGHSPSHIKDADLVVTSPALFYQPDENSEISTAKKLGKLMTWQKFLGKILLKDKKLICIAGTHGKSTTTAIAAKLLIDNGFDPVVVVGANVPEWNGNSRFGKGEYAVVEADEFNDNFLNYHPEIAIINNIEFDHPDYFKNEAAVINSFRKFATNLVGRKILITEKDSLNKKFKLKILGDHNQKNANMVFLLGLKLGISEEKIVRSIEAFAGIGRRLEMIADRGGIKVYDDYAHHPTAIKTTLEGLRAAYPDRRIIVVNEPHGFLRTKALLKNYKRVFDSADKVIIGPIFKARDKVDSSISSRLIAETSGFSEAVGADSFKEIKSLLKKELRSGDIVLVMGAGKSYLWAREIVDIIPLHFSDVTSFRVGGGIKKYIEVSGKDDVPQVVKSIKKEKLPLFILGGGSDILVSDRNFDGIVIKYTGKKIEANNDKIICGAGSDWDDVVNFAVGNKLSGAECLSGIPGTTGAAPIQNIGAYGQELKDIFLSLEAYDIGKEKFVTFYSKDCGFGYRDSIFKSPDYWQKYLIIDVTLKLTKGGSPKIQYESLANYLTERNIHTPTLSQVRDAVIAIRAGKFEDPKKIGNAGSFFKNPVVIKTKKDELELKYPDIKTFAFGDNFKIAGGWLIEKSGWKGKHYKSAAVSTMHSLILVNPDGKAKAEDIYGLSEQIIADVFRKFDIKLEREVQLINF